MALAQPKTLIITIDGNTAMPLQITYKIDPAGLGAVSGEVMTELTGNETTDTDIINDIFSTFLKDSTLISKYNNLILENARSFKYFSNFVKALGDLTEPELIAFNIKALNAVLEYIESTVTPVAGSYFTFAAEELVGKQNVILRTLYGPHSSTVIASIRKKLSAAGDDPYKDPQFLSKYLNVKYWVSQFYAWLKEFKSDPFRLNRAKRFSKAAWNKNNDYRFGGKKTQKNKKVYYDEI
jgi:hypothetical protein